MTGPLREAYDELSISEVARQVGVRTSTLRYYEEIGLVTASRRVSGQRRYDTNILQRLAVIQTAQHAGFTLEEIRILFNDILPSAAPSPRWRDLVERKLDELNTMLLHVQSMKSLLEDVMNCGDPQLADCIYDAGQRHKISHSA
jgi:MerR family transcriptional regulator, redox-sensitive transcriptional activator SoxR